MCHNVNWISFWFPHITWSTVKLTITNFSLFMSVCVRWLMFFIFRWIIASPPKRINHIVSICIWRSWTMCVVNVRYYLKDSWFWETFRRRHLQTALQLSCDMKGLSVTFGRDDHIKHDIQILQNDKPPISWRQRESRSFRVLSKSESEPTSDNNSRTTKLDLKGTGNWTKTDDWHADSWQNQMFRSRSFGALSAKSTSVSH